MLLTISCQPAGAANPEFNEPAERTVIEQTAEALRERGFNVEIASDHEDARDRYWPSSPTAPKSARGPRNP